VRGGSYPRLSGPPLRALSSGIRTEVTEITKEIEDEDDDEEGLERQ